MRLLSSLVCVAILSLCSNLFAGAPSTQPVSAAFEKMKSLEGEWKGKDEKGEPSSVNYKLVAANSAVMETLNLHDGSMVTVYTPDNDRLLMTHYCIAHNQPRMAAKSLSDDGKTIKFDFVDATGMETPKDGHMHRLVITFVDADHIKQAWTFNQDGKDTFTEVISLERVK
jgi:hypothetical protein